MSLSHALCSRRLAPLVAAAVAALVLTGCRGGADGSDRSATTTPSTSAAPSSATPTPTPSATPTVIDYTHGDPSGGFVIMRDSDIENLSGAPTDFKTYLHQALAKYRKSDGDDSQCQSTILVLKLDPAGFASGAISDCGGAEAYWAKVDGAWKLAFDSQEEAPRCADLKKYRFPVAIGGKFCLDDAAKKVPYTV